MRKKGDRVVNGKLVRAQESSVSVAEAPVTITANPETKTFTSTGLDLSKALDDEMKSDEHIIVLKFKGTGAAEVTMTGFWNGRLLSAAMRAIEKKYDEVRKHATVWAMKQSQNQAVTEE